MSKTTYQKLQLRDQILLRPDTYIGSVNTLWTPEPQWIAGKENFEYRMVRINDGLLRLVIEVISNAIDNVWRSVEAKNPADRVTPHFIKITFDENKVSVWNDGANISTKLHDAEQVPIPELIFGHLLTSSNYNDNEERKTSGKNGIGAKACNLFSKSFSLSIYNKDEKTLYKQDWTDNMKVKSKPIFEKKGFPTSIEDGKNGFTCITFSPDFERFGETSFNTEHLAMIRKLCIDAAMTVSFNKVKVVMNGELIPMNELNNYVNYYFPPIVSENDSESDIEEDDSGSDDDDTKSTASDESNEKKKKKVKEEIVVSYGDCKVILRPSRHNEYTQVSFVNGIQTIHGGVHVEAWCEAFFRPLVTRMNAKRDKSLHIDIRDIKKHFFVFVFASVDKPKFDSQSKTRLIGPEVKTDVKTAHLSKLMKWNFIEKIEESLKIKELATLRKSTERKKGNKINIEGFDDAYYAGKKQSQDCTLFITEGLSAKQYIVNGLTEGLPQFGGKAGRDYIGILPIRGKFLNVRNATAQTLSNNKEVKHLIQTLGLQFELDYSVEENRKKLRYGRLVSGCDNDVDGFHITGLLYNFFHTLFPSLLKNNDFFYFMRTPIVKIDQKPPSTAGSSVIKTKKSDANATPARKITKIGFFNLDKAREYITANKVPKTKIDYFKGLGTSTKTDIKEDFGRRIVQLVDDEKTSQLMEYIFSKDHTSYRKEWLKTYDPEQLTIADVKDYELEPLTVPTFLNEEMIQFSIDDCRRSIPHLLDGFKESHRKVMYAAFKRNIQQKIKVAQFAGSVAELSEYHHGEVNLYDTIIKLAQSYVGANNIPLLSEEGNFGCLDPETPILMWNGSIQKAKDIKLGDTLVGDDGRSRTVLQTTSGIDEMFEIRTKYGSYKVNSQHILTLYYPENFKVLYKPKGSLVFFTYFDGTVIKQFTVRSSEYKYTKTTDHFNKSTLSLNEAYAKVNEKRNELLQTYSSSSTIDIKLEDYIKLSPTNKKRLFGISNSSAIQWPAQSVPIDPYIFGLWLGDGNSNGSGFTSIDDELLKEFALYLDTIDCDLVHHSAGKNHDNYHYTIRKKGYGYRGAIGDKDHNSENCVGCKTGFKPATICNWKFDKKPPQTPFNKSEKGLKNNWVQLLIANNFINNKHIPDCYKYNSPEVRLKLLAGFIDTDGCLKKSINTEYFEISQSKRLRSQLIYDLEFIAKSLGFCTGVSDNNKNDTTTSKGESKTTLTLRIYGDNIEQIPTKLLRKQVNTTKQRQRHTTGNVITVTPLGKGPFRGWSVNENERFLLGDFQVTHNSRLENGKDAASARYIFTKLEPITRLIFRKEDEDYLPDRFEDGNTIEKEYYLPIIPMVLVNPTLAGIGTGWSCNIPGYNPRDLVQWIRFWIDGEEDKPSLKPWYKGFMGSIDFDGSRVITKGVYKEVKKDTYLITEIPIGKRMLSITKYKTELESLRDKGLIRDIRNNSTDEYPHFTITVEAGLAVDHKVLGLIDGVSTTNMVLFDTHNRIRKYHTPEDILDEYCVERLQLYDTRRKGEIQKFEHEELVLSNKIRFIQAILNDDIVLKGKDEATLSKELEKKKYAKIENGYDYLLSTQVRNMTAKKIEQIENQLEDIRKMLAYLRKITAGDLWKEELDELEKALPSSC